MKLKNFNSNLNLELQQFVSFVYSLNQLSRVSRLAKWKKVSTGLVEAGRALFVLKVTLSFISNFGKDTESPAIKFG